MSKKWLIIGIIVIVLIILIWVLISYSSSSGNTIPTSFTGKRLEIGDTGKYITYENGSVGNIAAQPYMDSPDQLWDYSNLRLITHSDKGVGAGPNGESKKQLRWWTNGD